MCDVCEAGEYLYHCIGCGLMLCEECFGEENTVTPFSVCQECE